MLSLMKLDFSEKFRLLFVSVGYSTNVDASHRVNDVPHCLRLV